MIFTYTLGLVDMTSSYTGWWTQLRQTWYYQGIIIKVTSHSGIININKIQKIFPIRYLFHVVVLSVQIIQLYYIFETFCKFTMIQEHFMTNIDCAHARNLTPTNISKFALKVSGSWFFSQIKARLLNLQPCLGLAED